MRVSSNYSIVLFQWKRWDKCPPKFHLFTS